MAQGQLIQARVSVMCFVIGLWLFHRSHADLGTNWSITLDIREGHRLITQGVYRRVRHPMDSALVLYSVRHALVIPNWVAGLSNLVAFAVLFALRVGAEERMTHGHDSHQEAMPTTSNSGCVRRIPSV
jgi:protein-S-isoprenylcysteine O-methyltransferase Ste14